MITQEFEKLSKEVWKNIFLAKKYGILYGEETITDYLLLELSKLDLFNIRILQLPKVEEANKGADWEWFVGSKHYGWIRFAIQAKKLNLKDGSYSSLNHKVGKPPNQSSQFAILEKYSKTNKVIPFYSFYNYFEQAEVPRHWHCSEPFDKELLGWTFTTLSNVKKALSTRGHRKFDNIHKYEKTLPIRCLFKCPRFVGLYQNNPNDDEDIGSFFGVKVNRLEKLPNELVDAKEVRELKSFPSELFDTEFNKYPKRMAIIELTNLEMVSCNINDSCRLK